MSTHTFSLYTDSSKAASSNERLVVISFKTPQSEVGNPSFKKAPTLCISIPKLTIACEPSVIADALTSAFYDMQNSYLRSVIVEKSVDQRQGTAIDSSDLEAANIARWLSSSSSGGGRLSSERIEEWFNSAVSEPLTLLLANRMGLSNDPTAEELQRLETAVAQRRILLSKIAGPGVPFNADITKQLIKAVEPAEDSITKQQVLNKLNSYTTKLTELDNLL